MRLVPGRRAVAALCAVYGVLVAVANSRNDVLTNDFTTKWVLVGGRTDFPGDFGRNVLAGSVGLGALLVVLALGVWFTAGRRVARLIGTATALFAFVLVGAYRDTGNLLAARASAAAVLLAVALYLMASALSESEPSR